MEDFKMIWDIVAVVLVVATLALSFWERVSNKKFSIDRRINHSALKIICLTLSIMINFFAFMFDMLLLQTSTVRIIFLCVLIVLLVIEVWKQTKLVKAKTKKDLNEWGD